MVYSYVYMYVKPEGEYIIRVDVRRDPQDLPLSSCLASCDRQ